MCESAAARPGVGSPVPGGGAVPCVVPSRPCSPSPPCSSRPPPRSPPAVTPPATSCRRATTAACRPPPTRRDQLPLYAGLTPLRGHVTDADIERLYLPENFAPVGATHEEQTGRPGLRLVYDSYGVPHVYGKTRADVAFGAGWATARDRGLLLQLGRGPARVAVADVPGINAFWLVTSGQSFVPSAATEALVTDQQQASSSGPTAPRAAQIIADAQAEADGINAYCEGAQHRPAAGHGERRHRGDRVHRLDLRRRRRRRGVATPTSSRSCRASSARVRGHEAWDDVDAVRRPRGADHDQRSASTTGRSPAARSRGSVVIDAGSIVSLDPTAAADARAQPGGRRSAAASSAGRVRRPRRRRADAGLELPRRRRRSARPPATRSR